uniref:BHLH domain-containing protein n=1 Tax=Macrostomum lignano TaxID=282301 RepID=A0A1I8FQY1_9PLAT
CSSPGPLRCGPPPSCQQVFQSSHQPRSPPPEALFVSLVDLELFGLQLLQLSHNFRWHDSAGTDSCGTDSAAQIPMHRFACTDSLQLIRTALVGIGRIACRLGIAVVPWGMPGAGDAQGQLHSLLPRNWSLAENSSSAVAVFLPLFADRRARGLFAVQLGPRRSQLRTAIGFPGRLRARSGSCRARRIDGRPLLSCPQLPDTACEQPETRQSQHSYMRSAPRESHKGRIIPPIKLNSRCTNAASTDMSSGASSPAGLPSAVLPRRRAAAWDFRSGGTGGGAGGSADLSCGRCGRRLCWTRGSLISTTDTRSTRRCTRSTITRAPAAISRNPFDNPQSRIPLRTRSRFHFGLRELLHPPPQTSARARERVRFVNEGYERLKETLPFENKDKRISKVEILKTAIRYIQHMESLPAAADQQQQAEPRSSGLKRRPLGPELQAEPQEKRLRAGLTGEGAAAPGHKGLMAIACTATRL